MTLPPPLPPKPRKSKRSAKIVITIIIGLVVIGAIGLFMVVRFVTTSGLTRPLDNKFGDQHLKTTVALLELHKARYGRYPQSLSGLKFSGEWDQLALMSVRYYAAPDGSKYCVEVARGWMGKPALEYPPEFWQGTGYSASLCPHSH